MVTATTELDAHSEVYSVTTPIFQGPLDLLLHLIERAELDITRLALAQVTDQYLGHLDQLKDREAEEVSSFLVIAAKLLQIKSEMLLPKPPAVDLGEEDPGNDLAYQLMVYKKFKELAKNLGAREKAGLRTYLSMASPPEMKTIIESGEVTLEDLVLAARNLLARIDDRMAVDSVVVAPKITIKEKISQITNYLQQFKKGTFRSILLDEVSHTEIVVTFLAMLELIKMHLIVATQPTLFGEIEIFASDQLAENDEFEFDIEFDE